MPNSGLQMPFYILKFIFVTWSFFFNTGNILTSVALLSFLAKKKKTKKQQQKKPQSIPYWTQKILPC